MSVTITNKSALVKKILFANVSFGQWFTHGGSLYCKTTFVVPYTVHKEGGATFVPYNVIDLNGSYYRITDDLEVTLVDLKVEWKVQSE